MNANQRATQSGAPPAPGCGAWLRAGLLYELRRIERLFAMADTAVLDAKLPNRPRTVRDTLCHISWYYPADAVPFEVERLKRLAVAGRTSPRGDLDLDALNGKRIRDMDGVPVDQIWDRIRHGREALMEAVDSFSEPFLCSSVHGTIWGRMVSIGEIVARSTFKHDEEHILEIESCLAISLGS